MSTPPFFVRLAAAATNTKHSTLFLNHTARTKSWPHLCEAGSSPYVCRTCSYRSQFHIRTMSWRPLREASSSSHTAHSWSKASTSRCEPASALGPMRARASWPRIMCCFSATSAPAQMRIHTCTCVHVFMLYVCKSFQSHSSTCTDIYYIHYTHVCPH
jgi:hypothetical protein